MSNKIFIDSGIKTQSAYFGWQDKSTALSGLKEGYKNTADNIIDIALEKGSYGDINTLDTYIFPVLFSYRHCIEISLKHIYLRCFNNLRDCGHDLLTIYDKIKKKFIDECIHPEDCISKDINFDEIRCLIKELQGADNKADVWRYLMSKDAKLYFTECKFVDYIAIKDAINYLYGELEYLYNKIDKHLSL